MAFKWTVPRTWVAGEKPPAATLNDHIRNNLEALNGFVRKTADESVTSSAVLQNDDHLLFSIPQAGTYAFEFVIFATSAANAAGDIQIQLTGPTGTFTFGGVGLDITLASGNTGTVNMAGISTTLNFGVSTTQTMILIKGILVATASGTLQLQWAQQTSNANATTVKAGSHMFVRQVAA